MVTHSHLLVTAAARAALGRDAVAKEVDSMEAFPFFFSFHFLCRVCMVRYSVNCDGEVSKSN